jgi:hypothetical protein
MVGFETIGSATIIAYDDVPIVATDPWINGDAYFGSWGLSHQIPSEQMAAIKACKFYWMSHGHPDHLNLGSLAELSQKEILLAEHRGNRICGDLSAMGFRVRVLPERTWISLSPNIKVLTISDPNQDSILLLDIGGTLVINLNDASDCGWGRFVKSVAKGYRDSYLLRLWSYGDGDMGNFFTETGERVSRRPHLQVPLGPQIQHDAVRFGARYAIPFSSFHRYQRADSIWANERVTPMEKYTAGQLPDLPPVLPPFLRINVRNGEVVEIGPPPNDQVVHKPEEFGDSWSDRLDASEKNELRAYFQAKEHLRDTLGFIAFRVGGESTTIDLNKARRKVGITFEVPRQSLVTAVHYRIFDDLLIGNFMKTTLHGVRGLYPDFSPYVAKYADNGGAETKEELREYFHHYRSRDPIGYLFRGLEQESEAIFRKFVPHNSLVHRLAKRLYWKCRSG